MAFKILNMKQLVVVPFLLMATSLFAQKKEALKINFEFNKYDLTPESISTLDHFISLIDETLINDIFLAGHTDSKGSDAYNEALSVKRVNTVKDYILKHKKISPNEITVKGFGERNLINTDSTEEESLQNRRVEITYVVKQKNNDKMMTRVVRDAPTLTNILEDTTTRKGALIALRNLEFENSSDVLLPASVPVLQELLDALNKNPKLSIAIEGHICCVPPVEGVSFENLPNFNISVIRAKKVYDYLIEHGVNGNRMSYTGFGNSRPLYPIPEKNETEIIANRRVEIRIIDK